MKRIAFILVILLFMCSIVFAADQNEIATQKTMIRKAHHMQAEKAPFEVEVLKVGDNLPSPFVDPDNAPWSASYNASSGNSSDPDRDVHIEHGSDGSIWLSWDANTTEYSVAIAKSVDDGQTWDVRYYGASGISFQYSCININDAGYLRLWTTFTGSYDNDIAWLQSLPDHPNDIDNLDGWYWFGSGGAEYYHEPQTAAWGGVDSLTGVEIVGWTNKNPETGPPPAIDTVEIWWTDDWGANGWHYMGMGDDAGYHGMRPTVGVCVPGDTFRMIAFETDTNTATYNVNFWRIDSIVNDTVWSHGWSSYHLDGTRCPSLAAEGNYAYLAYEQDDGTGQWDIMFNYSTDAGDNWLGTMFYIAQSADDERHPRLTSEGARVGATYTYDDGSVTNRFNYSDGNGAEGTWGTEEIITDATSTEDGVHCVDVMWYSSNNKWYAAWSDTRSGNTDVYSAYKEAGDAYIGTIPATPDSFLYFDYGSKGLGKLGFITKQCEKTYEPLISVGVQERIEKAGERELIGVLITMKAQISDDYMYAMTASLPRKEKARFVFNEKRPFADETQAELLAYLEEMESQGKATRISSIFTGNRIGVRATKEVIETVARRDDVGWITPEVRVSYFGYAEGVGNELPIEPLAIEANLIAINADDVWADGYAGQDIIAAVMDGGSNYNHNDLNDHIWTASGQYPNGGWDYENGDNDPYDSGNSHGTICAGIVCGDGTAGDTTGVAPECSLMILQTGTNVDMHNAVDFAIAGGRAGAYGDPADVITSSVGFEYGQFGSDAAWENMKNEFRPDGVDLRNAGIPWTCAAGNGNSFAGGHYSAPDDIIIPANSPPPWLHPDQNLTGGTSAVIAVGATNNARSRTTWSSFGPSDWDNGTYSDYPYNFLNMGLLRPDIMAPGSNITSVHNTNNSAYDAGNSGTSFSAPHLCGAIALMLSKDGSLTPARIDSIIETTAVPVISSDPPGKDSLNGSGFLDIEAACLSIGTAKKEILKVYNDRSATANLMVTGITHSQPWVVKVDPTSFTVAPDDTQYVAVWVDTTGFGLGPVVHYDTLLITSNSSRADTIVEVRLDMTPLNITMTNLTATGYYGSIELNWRTMSEFNTEAWQIMKSDASEGQYEMVGALPGYGSSAKPRDYSFMDEDVTGGKRYFYKLVMIDNMGKTTYGPVSAVAKSGPTLSNLKLASNPSRNGQILFNIGNESHVSLKVYNISGRLVKTLINKNLTPQKYNVKWDGTDSNGKTVCDGVYFIRMDAAGEHSTLKLTLLK